MSNLREKIADATYDLERAKDKYLRASGWTYSCSNPAALWLWEREIDGRTLAVSTDVAIRLQECMDEDNSESEDVPT